MKNAKVFQLDSVLPFGTKLVAAQPLFSLLRHMSNSEMSFFYNPTKWLKTAIWKFLSGIFNVLETLEINATNNYGQTELHVALLGSSVEVIHNLIKRGADVNVQDDERRTPLHYAVDDNNLEAVCMLLYYGADVGALCKDHMTPFRLAVYRNYTDIAEVLFNYYDFLETDLHDDSVLQIAARNKSQLALDLVNAGIDVNSIPYDDHHPLMLSLSYESADLFKLIWAKVDQKAFVTRSKWFLLGFIESATFPANEFLECMYMILSSPIALTIVNLLCEHIGQSDGLFFYLLDRFYQYDIELDDRISIILMCLGLGYTVTIDDVNFAMVLYGFNEELDIFLYAGGYTAQLFDLNADIYLFPQPAFIFSVNDVRSDLVIELFKKQIETTYYSFELFEIPIELIFLQNNVVNALRFFSLSFGEKQQLLDHCTLYLDEYDLIAKKLIDVPEVPSLLELSRNQSRVFIQRFYKITYPYQFHDVFPSYLKDIIMFKTPIY